MVEHGGLHSVGDVKALILYISNSAALPLTQENFTEIVLHDGLVNYFDFSQAFQELLQEGLLDILSVEENNRFVITEIGTQTEKLYEKNLPFNVKKKTLAALTKVLAKIQRDSNTHTEIVAAASGYHVICRLCENDQTLLEYKVLVPDELQAHLIADQFSKFPTEKYQAIMSAVIDENLFE
ncbi:MAG: DUF4364 family protein [Clostridia bacterium]|nr:DUF4364 family protein [Clostridia bacterium]